MSKMKRHLEESVRDICLSCGENYPPNGIIFCDDCGMDKDIEQQQEREGV
jgi:hypothetical protein